MIRPIETQMLLPRTESVGQSQQHENQKVVNDNTFAANEVAKEVKQNSETVVKKDSNEFTQYQYDAREEGNGTYENPKKKRKKINKQDEDSTLGEQKEIDEVDLEKKQPRVNIQI